MQFLVQKASLSLFLQEQHRLYERNIEALRVQKDLADNLVELSAIDQKLEALDEEIARDPNVDLLIRIIEAARVRPIDRDGDLDDLPTFPRAFLLMNREILRTITRIFRI